MTNDVIHLSLAWIFTIWFIFWYVAGAYKYNPLIIKILNIEKLASLSILLVYLWMISHWTEVTSTFEYFAMWVAWHLIGIDLWSLFNKYKASGNKDI